MNVIEFGAVPVHVAYWIDRVVKSGLEMQV